MKQIFNFSIITIMALNMATAQSLDIKKMKAYEQQLEDVMELMDTNVVKSKLQEVERDFQGNPTELNKVRLGLIYHETALNLSFLSKTTYKGYAQKSYDVLNDLFAANTTTAELMPFVASYRASALSLVGAETRKLNLISVAFKAFENAVTQYAAISYCPEFLRGSVAENLPWFFFKKRRFAKQDFDSIVEKQHQNPAYANWKIMSFTYWAWANKHRSQKAKAIEYLDKAIALDPNYQAGRKRAEALQMAL